MADPTRREILVAGSVLATAPGLLACAGAPSAAVSPSAAAPSSTPVPPGAEERDAALRELLAKNRTRHPRYRGGLANHLSMALWSQHALGASAERLRSFAARYDASLDPLPPAGPEVEPARWTEALGHDEALHGLLAHFERALRERGREAVLREALGVLAPTVSSAAFHCLIRTAFGVRFGDDAEVAHGLAYWAVTADSLGAELRAPEGERGTPRELLERIRADAELAGAKPAGGSILGRMRAASRLAPFPGVAGALRVDARTLDDMALAMLELYASTGDFTALHAVTGTHALRVLLPFAAEPEALLRWHWQALAAAYVGIGAPAARGIDAVGAPDWAAIAAPAVESADDHDAKLVFACREEHAHRGGDLYRHAAARRVRLLG